MMKVRDTLIKADRLSQVLDALKSTSELEGTDSTAQQFIDDNNIAKHRVDGNKVREQAKTLIEQIDKDDVQAETDFMHLY